MKRIYFAAPLFNEMELKRNEEYTILLEKWGYEVYLPQREAGLSAQILKDESKDKLEINKRIFRFIHFFIILIFLKSILIIIIF